MRIKQNVNRTGVVNRVLVCKWLKIDGRLEMRWSAAPIGEAAASFAA